MATTSFNWNWVRISLLVLLIAAIAVACFTLPVEKTLKDFLLWVENDLGPWGPLALAVAYIPLTILAVPASVLTLGGGYLFGLPMGFLADSIGAVIGATAAFLLGKTIGRSYVISKLGDYPQFRAVAIAIQKSGFKIVLLLRLVPLLPFNMLNYLLSVTPISIWEYVMASWLGMMPITFALVYVGTTLKDLADVTHGWSQFSKTRWALVILSFVVSVILMVVVTKVAKSALEKALAEGIDIDGSVADSSSVVEEARVDIHESLLVKG
ncbi:putative SNARE associated golgi family protein [Helianthus debilis subsp. tardiflorus]